MKLALMGTHGVGKTTLAYEVCSLLKKADHHVELAKDVVHASSFPVDRGSAMEGQLWILHTQIAGELQAAAHAPHVICDRSVLDNYCYLVSRFGRQPKLETWLSCWMDSYSLLVSVPPRADGMSLNRLKSESLEYQERIHELIAEMLSMPPFYAFYDRVLWLDPRDRDLWGETVFAAAMPLLDPAARVRVAAG